MKKLFAILALVLGMVSCQTEPEGLDVVVGGEQDVNITVALPEGTRADSAQGFNLNNLGEYSIRYILEISYNGKLIRDVQISTEKSVKFPVRLAPGRDYTFTVWADLVKETNFDKETWHTTDLYYNTAAGLANITFNDWTPNVEARDAWTATKTETYTSTNKNIGMELRRPFAKVRVVATDIQEIRNFGIEPTNAVAEYAHEMYTEFDAVAGVAKGTTTGKKHEFAYTNVDTYEGANGEQLTVFADYVLVPADGNVQFTLSVYDNTKGANARIKQNNFNTTIPVVANKVTTIKGHVLTDGGDLSVDIENGFDNKDNLEDAPYYQEVISSAAELFRAFERGGNYILNEDLTIDAVPATISTLAATRSANDVTTIVDLNRHAITVKNTGENAMYTVEADEKITFVGEGTIELTEESTAPFIENKGTVEVTSAEIVNTDGVAVFTDYVDYVDELRKAFANGGEYTMVYDVVYPETLVLEAGKTLVLNLNGKTISQSKECTGNYNMVYNKGNLTINGEGKISFKDTGAGDPNFGWGSYTLRNEGTLVVNGGTIEHLGEQNPGNGQPNVHMYCAIFQYSGDTTINGGVISTPTYRSARLWNGEMTINDGQFVGQLWLQAVSDNANLVINGGKFCARGNDGSSVFVSNSGKTVKCSINGGFFANKIGMSEAIRCIAGGEFTTAAKEGTAVELLADGYSFSELENGNWTLSYTISTVDQLKAFRDAVDSGNTFEGQTVKLAADIDLYESDENGEAVPFDPIGDYRSEKVFKGTFDGQGYTIKNLNQNTWALNIGYYYSGLGLGLFACVEDATIKNLKMDHASISGESALCGIVAATAYGNCTFENITVTNSQCADYQYYAGGIVGWASGNHQYINCNIDASTTVAAQWGDFDNSTGGVIGGVGGSAKVFMKDCTVACRIDAYNDVTSTYQWYAYRRCGMLIGNSGKTETTESGTTIAVAPQLTCENVKVIYGDWANYTYCEFAGTSWPYVRVQAGVSNSAYSNPRYGHPTDANGNTVVDDNHVHNEGEDHHILCVFDQLYGGGQGVYGNPVHEGVTVVYNNL